MEQKIGKLWYTFAVGNAHQTKRASGFTMIELMIVVVVIGILAAIALSGYRIQVAKVRNQEAIRALMAVWDAQKDYYRTNGAYAAIMGNLDVDFPSGLKHFSGPTAVAGTLDNCGAGPDTPVLATAVSLSEVYTLSVLDDGRVVCSPCGDVRCAKMGFPDW